MSEPAPGAREPASLPQSFGREVFGPRTGEYVAARPGYPPEVFERLVERGLLGPGRVVADVGSGTGLFSRDLQSHCALLYAIEPNAAMRRGQPPDGSERSVWVALAGSVWGGHG